MIHWDQLIKYLLIWRVFFYFMLIRLEKICRQDMMEKEFLFQWKKIFLLIGIIEYD